MASRVTTLTNTLMLMPDARGAFKFGWKNVENVEVPLLPGKYLHRRWLRKIPCLAKIILAIAE